MIDSLRQIRSFLAVARLGSFTRASIELHISQSALTVQIQQLERELRVILLSRSKRKAIVTAAGRQVMGPFQRILDDVASIEDASRDFTELNTGIVTIVVTPSLSATLLPRAFETFCRTYPRISIHIKYSAGNFAKLVKSDEVDFGIGAPIHGDRGILTQNLFTEPLCVFAPINHLLAKKRTVTLDELVEYTAILPEEFGNMRTMIDRALLRKKLHFGSHHESNLITTTVDMVNSGLGVAVLSRCAINCFSPKKIRCITIMPVLERQVVIASKPGHFLSPASKKLVEILRKVADETNSRIR